MMTALRRWRAEPPIAGAVATGTLRQRARRAQRKADRRLAAALDSEDAAMLHRARKAAKRARYAAELCQSLGKPNRATRTIKRYKRIQSTLGVHQDAVVAAEALRRMDWRREPRSERRLHLWHDVCARTADR
ncbi:CHAD domain-containing protein [Mycolicibacterium vulneris]